MSEGGGHGQEHGGEGNGGEPGSEGAGQGDTQPSRAGAGSGIGSSGGGTGGSAGSGRHGSGGDRGSEGAGHGQEHGGEGTGSEPGSEGAGQGDTQASRAGAGSGIGSSGGGTGGSAGSGRGGAGAEIGGLGAGGTGGGDGRYIDEGIGTLAGEGSHQRIAPMPPAGQRGPGSAPAVAWEGMPGAVAAAGEPPSYYGRPVLKTPVWIWSIPLYFYVGGTAGTAAVLGAAAQLAGGESVRPLVIRCRWVAATGGALSAVLLIHDLGRPERFLNMMRVFRPTSAMSIGSWVLAGAGGATAGSAMLAGARGGWLRWLGDAAGIAGALFGMPLAGYTSVLLANTAVPLWKQTRRTLPPLFIASAASGTASLFGLMPLAPREERIVHRFGTLGKVADLAAMAALERDAARVEQVAKPLHEGVSGTLWKSAKVLTAASLALSLLPRPRRRGLARAQQIGAGLLGTAGAVALRFAVFHAGKASARDPQATFAQQRATPAAREERAGGGGDAAAPPGPGAHDGSGETAPRPAPAGSTPIDVG
jgi:formate-dependent nitrite reductase membrane component NrfD